MKKFEMSREIQELINEIDVSDLNYEKASNRYKAIANYIKESNLAEYGPDIYVQGSMKLGTAIKPLTEDGAYDIDIVCNLTRKRRQHQTQKELKDELGKVVKNYSLKYNMENFPEESNRCWTLNYVDESNFHIDILPAVPWNDTDDGNIAISDKRSGNYENITLDWEVSNPKGYSDWFKKQSDFQMIKESYAKRFYAKIEEIPDYKIKTPLQRIVQLLKRHAEVMFEDDMEQKPSSVIITTLVAKVYPKCTIVSNDFKTLLMNVIKNLLDGIEYENEKPCIYNPINRKEKLSLKWDKGGGYFENFLKWYGQLKVDFSVENKELPWNESLFYIQRSLHKNTNEIAISLNSLSHHQKPKWKLSSIGKIAVDIKAYFSWHGFRFKGIKSGEALNKKGELKFEVNALTLNIKDYDIYWQITNTGCEAINADCLRGDFYNSKLEQGKRIRTEETCYVGRHYVEAYLVKNDICYGKSKPFEVNIIDGLTFDWFNRKKGE